MIFIESKKVLSLLLAMPAFMAGSVAGQDEVCLVQTGTGSVN